MIALCVCFLCACGGNEDGTGNNSSSGSEESVSIEELELGDVVSTDIMNFSLTRVEFADQLKHASFSSFTEPDKEYMLPTDIKQSNQTFVAKEGEKMLSYSYTIEFTGKEEYEFQTDMSITADYNNGYKFETWSCAYMWSSYVSLHDTTTLKPLGEAGEGRGCMRVPTEVATNDTAPLKLYVSVPNGDGTTTDVVYVVR